MPAYHSAFPKDAPSVCGLAMLPLKTRARGPAVSLDASAAGGGDEDQIDEALRLFRANVLFRNFEVQGAPDRTLIYLTLLIHQVRPRKERGAIRRWRRRRTTTGVLPASVCRLRHSAHTARPAPLFPPVQFIKKVEKCANRAEAEKILGPLASSMHHMPGEPGWPMGPLLTAPRTAGESDTLKALMKQLREALAPRLLDRLFGAADGAPNKHWMAFSKRKFLNKEFP